MRTTKSNAFKITHRLKPEYWAVFQKFEDVYKIVILSKVAKLHNYFINITTNIPSSNYYIEVDVLTQEEVDNLKVHSL